MNTDDLIAHARSRFDHAAARRILKEKYSARMLFAYQGGMFRAGPELLTVLHACPVEDNIVILDIYENPVRVNPGELQRLAHDRWQEQMNAWLVEYEQTNQQR
jgi:hypothetical protein